jgi:hypothetical protein
MKELKEEKVNICVMKKILLLISTMFLMSCASLEQSFNLQKAPQLINGVVPSAVQIGVRKQPKSEPYLRALVTIVNGFALGEDLTPEALEQAIKAAKVKELETPEALAVANSVVSLYKAYYDAAVTKKVAEVENLAPILKALTTAIEKGLTKV